MVALACWLSMPRFVQLDTLSSPSGLGTLKSLPIGFRVFRRMDHSVMHERQRGRGNAPAFHDWEKLVLFNRWLEFRILPVS
jgi:hypothetical protein